MVAAGWTRAAEEFGYLEGFRTIFMPNGRAPTAGETFQSEIMANTLSEIADSRGESFYRGRLASRIVADAARFDGALTEQDLAEHQGFWTDCIQQDFKS